MAESSPILGRWRITFMMPWDQEFIDAEVEGYIRFDPDGNGELQFHYLRFVLSWKSTELAGRPAAEWTWKGRNGKDPPSGRGWVVLRKDGSLIGKFIFQSGSSLFAAVRK